PGGEGADEDPQVSGIGVDAGAITQDGPTGSAAGGVDSGDGDALSPGPERLYQGVGEGGLADAWRSGQADCQAGLTVPGVVEQRLDLDGVRRGFQLGQGGGQGAFALAPELGKAHFTARAAWAAARRAMGTR